ncbi:MAG: hypothetical protein HRU14_10295 [Planctomycetes bacterium]|nr:hypothetical protein [Planctomycetota bacterium]
MRRVAILVVVFAATLSAQPALPIPGGAIVWTDTAPNSANMYDPATGMTTVLSTAPTLIWPSGILVTKQRDVVFADFNGLTLTRVDVLGNESPVGLVTNTPNRIAEDHNGDFLIAAYATGSWGGTGGGSPSSLLRVDSTGAWSYVATLTGNPYGLMVEPTGSFGYGDYVVTLPLQGELQRIDAAGTITSIATGIAGGPVGVANFPNGDYAVALSSYDSIIRVPRNGGTATTWVPSGMLGNIKDLLPDSEGGFYVTEAGGSFGSRLMHVDAVGAVTQVLGNSAFGILQAAAIAPHFIPPTNPGTGLAGLFGLAISYPQSPNAQYLTVASDSVFPGIGLSAGDPRSSPLNPTPFFLQSFGVGFPGITANWGGVLDGSGNGAVLLNLTPFPAGAFANIRVYLQVALIDPTSPSSVARISDMATLLFN